jgi:hypothetical protein
MGLGTTIYGKKDYNPQDGFYTATKWGIWFYFPIFPISSYRVRRTGSDYTNYVFAFQHTTNYQMLKIPLDVKQVLLTYLWVYGAFVLWVYLLNKYPDYWTYVTMALGAYVLAWVIKTWVDNYRIKKQLGV